MIESDLKYNFVFLFADSDYWEAILGKEVFSSSNSVAYLCNGGFTKIKKVFFHYHWSYTLNRLLNVPFKKIWYKDMYDHSFKNNLLPKVFVFMGGNNIRYAKDFCDYVKKKDNRNKIMILHNDIIEKHCRDYDYSEIKKMADVITTYDKGEAEKYEIEYFQETTFSKLVPDSLSNDYDYDVYFLGAAKDRLDKIHEAYLFLTSKGFNCKFIVTGVPKEKQINGIEYSKGITYRKNLEYVTRSKCVLEIVQGGSIDITTRAIEAIAYKKKFLTDCPMNLESYFNDKQLQQYRDVEDIDIGFIKETYNYDEFEPKIDLDPMKRLYFIQEKLENRNE